MEVVWKPLFGGVLIGLAVTLMLLFNGRVTGISGIINSAIVKPQKDSGWRWSFIAGLVLGGFVLVALNAEFFANTTGRSLTEIAIAGVLVGFGTAMGKGCTSGHGVCGVSRLSIRSIIATVTFIAAGLVTVALVKWFI